MTKWFSFAAFSGCLLGPQLASAHHAFSMFDSSQEVTISGTVESLAWTNPHVWLYVSVPSEDGGSDVSWGFEATAIRSMRTAGWDRTSLEPGDPVTVTMNPRKDGEPGGSMIRVELPDGSVLASRGERPSAE